MWRSRPSADSWASNGNSGSTLSTSDFASGRGDHADVAGLAVAADDEARGDVVAVGSRRE